MKVHKDLDLSSQNESKPEIKVNEQSDPNDPINFAGITKNFLNDID